MAWDAQGRWIPEKKVTPLAPASLLGQASGAPDRDNPLPLPVPSKGTGGPVAPDQLHPLPLPNPSSALADTTLPYDDSVARSLTGLLDQNSPYIQRARQSGLETANDRGLLNTSMAAGAAEGAAIDRALPIAAQDAAQASSKNLQILGDRAAMDRLKAQLLSSENLADKDIAAQLERLQLQLTNANDQQQADILAQMERLVTQGQQNLALQGAGDTAAMERLRVSTDASTQQGLLAAQVSLTNQQSSANVSLTASYLSALSELANNKDIPAGTRDAYVLLYTTIANQTRGLVQTIVDIPISWGQPIPPAPAPGTPAPTPAPAPTPDVPALPAPIPAPGTPVPDAEGFYNPTELDYRNGKFYLPDGTEVPRNKLRLSVGGGGSAVNGGLLGQVARE